MENHKSLINAGVKSATGRELIIDGEFDLKLFSRLAFNASGVKFANARVGIRPQMISVTISKRRLLCSRCLKVSLMPPWSLIALIFFWKRIPRDEETGSLKNRRKEWSKVQKVDEKWKKKRMQSQKKKGGLPDLGPLIRKLHFNQARIVYLDGKSGDRIGIPR